MNRVITTGCLLITVAALAATGCAGDDGTAAHTGDHHDHHHDAAGGYQPPAAFEGLDPCSITTPAEAAALSGKPDPRPTRNGGMHPDMSAAATIDTCSWLVDGFDPLAVSFQLRDQLGGVEQGQDATSKWMAEQLGHPAHLSFGKNPVEAGVEDCAAFVGYSGNRAVTVLLRLRATAATPTPTDTDNLCSRNQTTLRDIFARTRWQ
ncbi:hypothetical protein [Nocardia ninae]|uniref:DUF3558 domain-containing protein n=1 Tax=Nocardia ninae NBRC 108245 TaxID=1210091 RepID=A0A511MDG9_9NOCA|nr:hypothetical protein [Nocardia ninae]GEM38148.1 hypothetical protein NN4_26670 [Nocardia ninae NBRC 108245]